jgi:sec-independent protein translocase protein TatA
MMGLSLPHLLIVAVVVLVLFGRGRISEMMGDFGKGIKSFKQGMADEETKPAGPPPAQIPVQPPVQQNMQQAPQPTVQPAPQQATLNGEQVVDTNQPAR